MHVEGQYSLVEDCMRLGDVLCCEPLIDRSLIQEEVLVTESKRRRNPSGWKLENSRDEFLVITCHGHHSGCLHAQNLQ